MNWREIVVRLPLPMLALAASWGVFSFQVLFSPLFFALVSALSFELVYIGLSMVLTPDRKKAAIIAGGAVSVSVIYNTLAGVFHRNPEWLVDLPPWAEISLAVLHGAPLALLAYLVADLLFHTQQAHIPDGSYSVPGNLLALASTQTILVMPAASSATSSSRHALPALPREALLEEVEEPAEEAEENEPGRVEEGEEVEEPAEERGGKKRQRGAGSSVTPEEEAAILAAAEEVEKERGSVNRSEVCRRVFQSPYRGRYSTKVKTVLDAVGR